MLDKCKKIELRTETKHLYNIAQKENIFIHWKKSIKKKYIKNK